MNKLPLVQRWLQPSIACSVAAAVSLSAQVSPPPNNNPAGKSSATKAAEAIPAGQRLFYCSHSLMWDTPAPLGEAASAYGIKDHVLEFFRNVLVVFIWLKMNMLGGRTRRKPENIDGFLNSTAGGRELRLKARPPACLIQWRMPLPSDSRGFCLWFSRTMAAGGSSTLWGKGDYPQWKTPRTFLKRPKLRTSYTLGRKGP